MVGRTFEAHWNRTLIPTLTHGTHAVAVTPPFCSCCRNSHQKQRP